MRFSTRVRDHIRGNVVGYIAIFMFAMGGSAYAVHPGGDDTIDSGDIIDTQVRTADIGNGAVQKTDLGGDAVTSGKIADGGVATADLAASSVTSGKVADDSLTKSDLGLSSVGAFELDSGAFLPEDIKPQFAGLSKDYGIPANAIQSDEISNNTLTGADIDEGTLGPVPNGAVWDADGSIPAGTSAVVGSAQGVQFSFDCTASGGKHLRIRNNAAGARYVRGTRAEFYLNDPDNEGQATTSFLRGFRFVLSAGEVVQIGGHPEAALMSYDVLVGSGPVQYLKLMPYVFFNGGCDAGSVTAPGAP